MTGCYLTLVLASEMDVFHGQFEILTSLFIRLNIELIFIFFYLYDF